MKNLLDLLDEEFGEPLETSGDELRYCCPLCEDSKYKLYINPIKCLFYCQHCEWKGHLVSIFKGDLKGIRIPRKRKREIIVPDIPTDSFEPLLESTSELAETARNYLKGRDIFCLEDILLGLKGDWLGRIIFPVIERGKIVFAVGRSIIGSPLRYKNTEGKKSHYVYRLKLLQNAPNLVICEGCIDALTVNNGVALFGKDMSVVQYGKIMTTIKPNIPIYIGLDGSARTNAIKLASKMFGRWRNVFLLDIPEGEDLNSLGVKWRNLKAIPITRRNLIKLKAGRTI